MTDLSEEIKDLERSAAYNILEELYRNGSLSKAEMDLYKSKYAKLHEMVIQTFENEQNFVTRAKQLNQRLMQEKIKLEKTTLESQEDQNCIEQLLHQKFEIEQEYQVAQDREMMLQIQLSELDHDRAEKQEQLREREIERQAEAEPKLRKARDEIELLNKESDVLKARKETYQEKLEEYNARIKEVEQEMENNRDICKVYESEHTKIKEDPDRIRKQVDVAPSKGSEVKDVVAREMGMYPYAFKLITAEGVPVEGGMMVTKSQELTLVKIDGVPSPDARGYLQLQPAAGAESRYREGRNRRFWLTLAVLLLAALVGCFIHDLTIGMVIVYVAYLLEALFFNPTARGLMRLKQTECILDYIEEIKACRPVPEVTAQCYHDETRYRQVRQKDGTYRTEAHTERVDTARITERLLVARWEDATSEVVDGLGYFPLLQVHFELRWQAADEETLQAHERQHVNIRARAAAADSRYDIDEKVMLLDEHGQECALYADVIGTTGDSFPCWLGYAPYAVCSVLCLSWAYRYVLSAKAVKGDFVFEKRVWSHVSTDSERDAA
ncbi:unnamed protein product [Effrenium voratum]|nr:unnamed protein product [Effrenium voratum]